MRETDEMDAASGRNRLVFAIPLVILCGLAGFFAVGLTKDPHVIPSALIDQPAPSFDLPPIEGYLAKQKGFATSDLKGGVSVVNIFASWCAPCRAEHPNINRLAEMNLTPVYGLNYKDEAEAAIGWLAELGDGYTAIGADRSGRAGIEWGVYGVPETFIVDKAGRIRYKKVGPIVNDDLETEILPIIRQLLAEG